MATPKVVTRCLPLNDRVKGWRLSEKTFSSRFRLVFVVHFSLDITGYMKIVKVSLLTVGKRESSLYYTNTSSFNSINLLLLSSLSP